MSIIEEIYNGKRIPVEEAIPTDADYRPLADKIGSERDYFSKTLSEEDRERFNLWNKDIFKYEEMTELANFEYGFKLGAMLVMEIFM